MYNYLETATDEEAQTKANSLSLNCSAHGGREGVFASLNFTSNKYI